MPTWPPSGFKDITGLKTLVSIFLYRKQIDTIQLTSMSIGAWFLWSFSCNAIFNAAYLCQFVLDVICRRTVFEARVDDRLMILLFVDMIKICMY